MTKSNKNNEIMHGFNNGANKTINQANTWWLIVELHGMKARNQLKPKHRHLQTYRHKTLNRHLVGFSQYTTYMFFLLSIYSWFLVEDISCCLVLLSIDVFQ
jgi:hypothetical protein